MVWRVTESGDYRVLENGLDYRIVEALQYGSVSATITTTITITPVKNHIGQVIAGVLEFTRITENGDTRITEIGDTRITEPTTYNLIITTLLAEATKIPFNSVIYAKYNGEWKVATCYVKYGGNWVEPDTSYRYPTDGWKRVE